MTELTGQYGDSSALCTFRLRAFQAKKTRQTRLVASWSSLPRPSLTSLNPMNPGREEWNAGPEVCDDKRGRMTQSFNLACGVQLGAE